jgi:hypothetical protein
MKVGLVDSTVAKEHGGDEISTEQLSRKRSAGASGYRPANNSKAADDSVLEIYDVHRTAPTSIRARRATHHFGK